MKNDKYLCGFQCWYPDWLQKYANPKYFMLVYGFLGTIQAMSYLYFIITLTTLERTFKITSKTTGILLTGNEISQIMLSLILAYIGGQGNRPRWIGIGVAFSALSCFVIASPHFLYGPGEDALQLTKEWNHSNYNNNTVHEVYKSRNKLCNSLTQQETCSDKYGHVFPLVLIFLSQFIMGIGNSLYYSLGQTYIDDNSKNSKSPMLLACALALRLLGPVIGFRLGSLCLMLYIDPSKTPIIDRKDPRWMGAWWLGWLILGVVMLLVSFLISLFPKELPKNADRHKNIEKLAADETDQIVEYKENIIKSLKSSEENDESPKLRDLPTALGRLIKNNVLMLNIASTIFYALGGTGYMTFIGKYNEVQFLQLGSDSTKLSGPLTLIGMIVGLLGSGYVITKWRPSTSKLLIWNIIGGVTYLISEFIYLFLYCETSISAASNYKLQNLISECNTNCHCEKISYSPVCDLATETTYFSPCHAGCSFYDVEHRLYSNCSCMGLNTNASKLLNLNYQASYQTELNHISKVVPGVCQEGCATVFYVFIIISMLSNGLASSGKIINIIINYRCVKRKDKAFSQGLLWTLISLLATIPGPIIFGWVIDKSCLLWASKCASKGYCQLYDQAQFRYLFNLTTMGLVSIGVVFDLLVWHYGKLIDFYPDN